MPIARSYPVKFTPKGLTDAFDASDAFDGACLLLQNLIFDESNPEIVVSRPGVLDLSSFPGFSSPGFVSVHVTIGNVVYGMIASNRNPGYEEPFAFDHDSLSFITISGVTGANVPAQASSVGDWVPPVMAVIGTKLVVTHPGFSGTGSNFFGVIDLTNPAAPAWSSANCATNPLPSVPTGVANYNNRAYFICGSQLCYSDVLVPTSRTNAGQAITVGDTTTVIALSGLPAQTQSGGVVGQLLAFKASSVWQISGDPTFTTNPIAINYLSLSVGTLSPRSVVPTPLGVIFAGLDAPYIVNLFGAVGPLFHDARNPNPDIRQPFQNCTYRSRVSACFAGSVYRLCMPTVVRGAAGTNDYWFDTLKRRWNGPHTFPYDCASVAEDGHCILTYAGSAGNLYHSEVMQSQTSVYTDSGAAISAHLQSATFPKVNHMMEKQSVESTIELSSAGAAITYSITAYNAGMNTIGTAAVTTSQQGVLWGSNIWADGSKWKSSVNAALTYAVPWGQPLVFKKMAIDVQAVASINLAIGSFFTRYSDTGYTLMGNL